MSKGKDTLHDCRSVEDALRVARKAHDGQFDKAGMPYILHVERVVKIVQAMGGDADAQIVAALHDVVEDTDLTLVDLRNMGLPDRLGRDVEALTKRPGEPKVQAAKRAAVRRRSRMVKLADNMDNTHPARVVRLYEQDPDAALRLADVYGQVREVLLASAE